MKKDYYDMTKKELENELNKANKKGNRCGIILIISEIVMGIGALMLALYGGKFQMINHILQNITIRQITVLLTISGCFLFFGNLMRIPNIKYKIYDIQFRLNNIITMEYEKNRYSMEKNMRNERPMILLHI